ncbi:hypothetical protein AB1Y20_015271 [Prymnesium parvum]|uniref:Uncharacterized protein n=1 Tax=Prymnesium parvum TaxID=97485 RepID=A0AB34JWL0_PRYPA
MPPRQRAASAVDTTTRLSLGDEVSVAVGACSARCMPSLEALVRGTPSSCATRLSSWGERKTNGWCGSNETAQVREEGAVVRGQRNSGPRNSSSSTCPQDSSDAEVDDETGAIVVGDADHEAEPQRAPQDVVPLGEWKRDDHCLQIVQVMQMPPPHAADLEPRKQQTRPELRFAMAHHSFVPEAPGHA